MQQTTSATDNELNIYMHELLKVIVENDDQVKYISCLKHSTQHHRQRIIELVKDKDERRKFLSLL